MAEVTVKVTGCRNDDGHVYAAMYRGPEGFPDDYKQAVYNGKSLVRNGRATFEIPDVEPGRYGFVLFHDENDDGVMNMRLKIFPKEGYGMSGKQSGMKRPEFEDAAIDIDGDSEVEIEMQYLL
jgi:uncharacterized protein (DUF2141 family)